MILLTSDAIKLGDNTIDKIYLGSDIVYTVSDTAIVSATLNSTSSTHFVGDIEGIKSATVSLTSASILDVIGTVSAEVILFDMIVESPHIPAFRNIVGGTFDIVETSTDVWRVTSEDTITSFNFHYEGGPEYYNQATSVVVVKGDTLTTLHGSWGTFTGLYDMTYFEWQGPCNATSADRAWAHAWHLEEIVLPDLSNVTDFSEAFYYNSALTSLPAIDTSNGTLFTGMFNYCESLVCLTNIDTTNQTDTTNMFQNCTSLVAPDATDQSAILAGTDWINSSPCGDTAPPIYNLTEVLIDG